jgi:phosphatidylserine decarboxylase
MPKHRIVAALWILWVAVEGRRNPFIAREGIPFLLLAGVVLAIAVRYLDVFFAVAAAYLFLVLYLLFRDPRRKVPPSPLGVVSPVDGRVLSVEQIETGVLQGQAHRIQIEIDSFGTYTARSPIEGKIMDLRSVSADVELDYETNALWLQTDEGDDVVLQFIGYRFGLAPRSFSNFGERVGQGQRCAYLRLTRLVAIDLPIASKVLVSPGQLLVAGSDLIGKVPSH